MKWFLLILILCTSSVCAAQDSAEIKKKLELGGYIKNLESLSFDKNFKNIISANLIHNRINLKWKPSEKITAVAELRNRIFWGEEVRLSLDFPELLRNENEMLDLQKTWIKNKSLIFHTNTERLYADYRSEKFNIRIGRQRINWGMAITWNPNDIFNTYNFLDFDYEERPGVDGVKAQYILKNSSNAELACTNTGRSNRNIVAGKYGFNKWNYDIQLIAGWYKEHFTAGAGWAGNIKDAGFRGELQYFFPRGDSSGRLNFTMETDYMFKKSWYISFGFLCNNYGLHKPVSNWSDISLKLSPENLMPAKWNLITTTSKEFTPLFSGRMSILFAPGTNMIIIFPSLLYNISANLDVNLVWQSFFTELNKKFQAANHTAFLRMKWSF